MLQAAVKIICGTYLLQQCPLGGIFWIDSFICLLELVLISTVCTSNMGANITIAYYLVTTISHSIEHVYYKT